MTAASHGGLTPLILAGHNHHSPASLRGAANVEWLKSKRTPAAMMRLALRHGCSLSTVRQIVRAV
jgi:hypothetical protein